MPRIASELDLHYDTTPHKRQAIGIAYHRLFVKLPKSIGFGISFAQETKSRKLGIDAESSSA